MRVYVVLLAAMLCGCGQKASTIDDLTSTDVTFPNGHKIRAQTMRDQSDLIRGMMFRDSLGVDRGMLFYHMRESQTPYYMFNVKIPLDIIWMDHNRRIVEIAPNVQPCPATVAQNCPHYGGKYAALFALELNAGFAAKNELKFGDLVEF
jgi:uncharacterized membrane protein (UPF0127 family)